MEGSWILEGEAWQYEVGDSGGFESRLVITLSPALWFPEENREDEENGGGCSCSA